MKNLKRYRYWAFLLLVPFLAVMCMTIEEIIHPDNPQVNSEIAIRVRIKIDAGTDDTGKLAFGVLAPKSWKIAENAELRLTTTGYTPGEAANELMSVIPANEQNPSKAMSWPDSFQSEFGVMNNYGPVEWVVFESQTDFQIDDKNGPKVVEAWVDIKLTTGSDNIKVFMGYAFCGKTKGFTSVDPEYTAYGVASKVLEVTGSDGPLLDYTTISLVSVVPSVYGFGDIFSVNFVEETANRVTELKGAEEVYLWGEVVYDGGQTKTIDEISSKTLMEKIGDGTWQKYIYPKDFFGLPANAVIEETYFHFSNKDQSIIVQNDDDEDFQIYENRE